MSFPDSCLRGIYSQYLNAEGFASTAVFGEQKEISINWEDDEEVLSFTLNYLTPDGKKKYGGGVARLLRKHLDDTIACKDLPSLPLNSFSYCRSELPENKYHGCINYREGLSKQARNAIAGHLALKAQIIH